VCVYVCVFAWVSSPLTTTTPGLPGVFASSFQGHHPTNLFHASNSHEHYRNWSGLSRSHSLLPSHHRYTLSHLRRPNKTTLQSIRNELDTPFRAQMRVHERHQSLSVAQRTSGSGATRREAFEDQGREYIVGWWGVYVHRRACGVVQKDEKLSGPQ
jgi:hypothetical protein